MPRRPSARGGATSRATSRSCARCSATRRRSRSGRRASTISATTRRTMHSSGCSTRELELARETGKPVVIHTRAADDDTLARLVEHDGPVVLHCFSSPPLLDAALEHGWYVSFAGNVTYKNAYELRDCAPACPRRPPARRDRQPVPCAPSRAWTAQRARVRRPHLRRPRRGCAVKTSLAPRSTRTPTASSALHERRPRAKRSASTSWSTTTSSA